MTKKEKRSLQYRLARRFDTDPRRVMEIVREEIKKSPLTEEPKKGNWNQYYPKSCYIPYQCSCCGKAQARATSFCPECGAYMESILDKRIKA